MSLCLDPPWLIADLGRPRQVLSFAPYRPGFVTSRHLLWRQVRDADLGPETDAFAWLADQVAQIAHGEAVAMMTSRDLVHMRKSVAGAATCIATVGLGNAERVGHQRFPQGHGYGTINTAVVLDAGLSDTAMIEAMTIIAEARTTAVIDAGLHLRTGMATGTGTDCIALACDSGDIGFAGLHTDIGRDIGASTYQSVRAGAESWIETYGNRIDD